MQSGNWNLILVVLLCTVVVISLLHGRPLKTTEQVKNGQIIYRSLSPQDGWSMLQTQQNVRLLDVRTPEEYASGHLAGSRNVPLDTLDRYISKQQNKKEQRILVYCRSGSRSRQAVQALYAADFTNVYDIGGMHVFSKHQPKP